MEISNKEKKVYKLDAYGERVPQEMAIKLKTHMESEHVLTDLSQTRKWRKCGENRGKSCKSIRQPEV